jgi:lysyl-tRNA synthetase class 1
MSQTGSSTRIPIPAWADRVADYLGEGPHVVVTGISPSGNIHNLREVLVAEAVANALRDRKQDVRFIFHADTADPLRKIAPGIPEDFLKYLGHSLSDVPDPEGCHASYAEHFLAPFEEALRDMGMDIEVLRSHELYENGFYEDVIEEALEHRDQLRDILVEVTGRTSLLVEDYWSPFVPRGSHGSLHNTRVIEFLPDKHKVRFEQVSPEDGRVEVREADYSKGEGKLQWRVELAARWKALKVTFEPFGKDHTSRGGSTDTADRMVRDVFHWEIPGRYEYEWISIRGKGPMSSSKGIVLLPKDLLRIMPPNALRKMMLGRDPSRALEIDIGSGFPRFMDEYRAEAGEPYVPFTHLVTVAQTVGDDVDAAAEMLRRGGYGDAVADKDRLARDLRYARNWASEWAPESMRLGLLGPEESREAAADLDDEQRAYLREVSGKLRSDMDGEAVQDVLYSTAIGRGLKPKRAFAAVYKVLLGRTSGPKAGPFIAGLTQEQVNQRFSL